MILARPPTAPSDVTPFRSVGSSQLPACTNALIALLFCWGLLPIGFPVPSQAVGDFRGGVDFPDLSLRTPSPIQGGKFPFGQ